MVAIASRSALRAACKPSLTPKLQHRLPCLPARLPGRRTVAARASTFSTELQEVFLNVVDRIEAVEDTTVQTLLHTPLACIPIAVVLVVVGPKAFEVLSKKVGGPVVGILLAWLILAHPSTLVNSLYNIEHVLEHQPVAVSVLILSIASLLIGPYLAMGAGTVAIASILGGIAVEKGWEAETGAPVSVPLRTIQADWQKANSEAQARGVAPPPSLPAPDLTAVKLPDLPAVPPVNLPKVDLPNVNLPKVDLPNVNLPSVDLPPTPPLPNFSWPNISAASFKAPAFSFPQLPAFANIASTAPPAAQAAAPQAAAEAPSAPAATAREVSYEPEEAAAEQPSIAEASASATEANSATEVSATQQPDELFADATSPAEGAKEEQSAPESFFAAAPASEEAKEDGAGKSESFFAAAPEEAKEAESGPESFFASAPAAEKAKEAESEPQSFFAASSAPKQESAAPMMSAAAEEAPGAQVQAPEEYTQEYSVARAMREAGQAAPESEEARAEAEAADLPDAPREVEQQSMSGATEMYNAAELPEDAP